MEIVAIVGVALGAALQSVSGFGFALVAAPALVAAHGGADTVSAIALLGTGLSLLLLAGEGRRPQPDARAAGALVAWALPGLPAGAVLLGALPERLVEALVGVAVLSAVVVRARASAPATAPRPIAPRDPATAAAGLACGALTTTTGINGPPLVLRLLAARTPPLVARDTLAVLFVLTGIGGTLSLLAAGAFELPPRIGALAAATVVGQVAGRPLLARLHPDRHETLVLAVLAFAGIGALASAAA